MIPSLLLLTLAASPACQEIRDVRALAIREGLDDATLRTLEARHCAAPEAPRTERRERDHDRPRRHRADELQPPSGASRTCVDLSMMARLAAVAGAREELRATVEAERATWCALGREREGTLSWPNGTTMRHANGSWQWPSGTTAKYANGSWQWPSGTTANYANGAWQYPSGTTAKYANGSRQRSDGRTIDEEGLVAAACREEPGRCGAIVERLRGLPGDFRELALIELGLRR